MDLLWVLDATEIRVARPRIGATAGLLITRQPLYSVPAHLCAERVAFHRSLDGGLVAKHRLRPATEGWQVVPDHHARLWHDLGVQTRSLTAYKEAATWN